MKIFTSFTFIFSRCKKFIIEENACSLPIIFPVTDGDSWSNPFIEFMSFISMSFLFILYYSQVVSNLTLTFTRFLLSHERASCNLQTHLQRPGRLGCAVIYAKCHQVEGAPRRIQILLFAVVKHLNDILLCF